MRVCEKVTVLFCIFMSLWLKFNVINKHSMRLMPKDKSMILL